MHTAAALTDIHERSHWSLEKLLEHCAGFTDDELDRELEGGFAYPSLRLQFHHTIGAERYWIGVLKGEMRADDDSADFVTVDDLHAFREQVFETTATYLRAATEKELNTRREMTTWGDNQVERVPAHVVLRTQTHIFQHQGQIAAMCRVLGRPIPPGLDFPLV